MSKEKIDLLFDKARCTQMLPPDKANDFFEALFGDASEGSYDIELAYEGSDSSNLHFALMLHERPGHCLACNLTQGLPQVFSRHPVIDVAGIVGQVDTVLGSEKNTGNWHLGATQQRGPSLHVIPLTIALNEPTPA